MNANKCIMTGRLTKDAESSITKKGTPMSKFRLAVNNRRNEKTLYINIVVFGKLAEMLQPKLVKGRIALIIGALDVEDYETEAGEKRTSVCVMADDIELGPDPDKIIKDTNAGSDDPGASS